MNREQYAARRRAEMAQRFLDAAEKWPEEYRDWITWNRLAHERHEAKEARKNGTKRKPKVV